MNAQDKLVFDLEHELEAISDPATRAGVEEILSRARAGFYGDFSSPLATPRIRLSIDLQAFGLTSIHLQNVAGKYDD